MSLQSKKQRDYLRVVEKKCCCRVVLEYVFLEVFTLHSLTKFLICNIIQNLQSISQYILDIDFR